MEAKKSATSPPVTGSAVKATRDRSPAYPFISLKVAIDRIAALESKFGRHPAPMAHIGSAWDLKSKSSQALQTTAALKYFGLIEYQGDTEDRAVRLTEDARNFLRAQQESIKAQILKRVALKPRAISTYWTKWGADRPIDEVCLDELVLKGNYTQSAADTFLKVYDETIGFAKLGVGDKVVNNSSDASDSPADQDGQYEISAPFPIGTPVSWESNGQIKFESKKITGFSDDFEFAFVEGSNTGLPVKEMSVVEQTNSRPKPSFSNILLSAANSSQDSKQDTFTLDEGTVVLQWPSKMSETSFEDFKDWVELQLRKIKRSVQ